MIDTTTIFIILGAIICAYVFGRHLFREKFPYLSRHTLLSDAELSFFNSLQNILPDQLDIHTKVRLADVITVNEKDWSAYGFKISSKHLDFVIVEKATSKICFAIELDDKTHDQPDRKKRDHFLNDAMKAANVPLYRVRAQKTYDLKVLRDVLGGSLNNS